MATAEQVTEEAATAAADEPSLPWREKLLRNWAFIRLAHEGLMLEKIAQQQKRVFQVADLAMHGKTTDATSADGDEMGLNIGNESRAVHYHYTTTPTTTSTTTSAASPAELGTLGKAALIAALVGGGGTVGALLAKYLTVAPAATTTATDTDTDTRTDVTFPE